jgi:hypothetical protein
LVALLRPKQSLPALWERRHVDLPNCKLAAEPGLERDYSLNEIHASRNFWKLERKQYVQSFIGDGGPGHCNEAGNYRLLVGEGASCPAIYMKYGSPTRSVPRMLISAGEGSNYAFWIIIYCKSIC